MKFFFFDATGRSCWDNSFTAYVLFSSVMRRVCTLMHFRSFGRVQKGPNSKGLNCHDCKTRVHINKQSLDITEDVADGMRVDKGDLDDISAVPQKQISIIQNVQEISQLQCIDKVIDDLVVQVPQTQIVERTVEIPQMQTVEKIAGEETSSLRQSAGTLQAGEKQPENDVSGRVSESRKCFQLGTQFRYTSSEHSTPEHGTQSTHIEHHHRDSTCTTTITDDELINDDEDKMGKGEQGGCKAIHARYGNRIQAMTEKELRRLMEENSGKYVVYDGKRRIIPRSRTRRKQQAPQKVTHCKTCS